MQSGFTILKTKGCEPTFLLLAEGSPQLKHLQIVATPQDPPSYGPVNQDLEKLAAVLPKKLAPRQFHQVN